MWEWLTLANKYFGDPARWQNEARALRSGRDLAEAIARGDVELIPVTAKGYRAFEDFASWMELWPKGQPKFRCNEPA
jgi:hypothetical protein